MIRARVTTALVCIAVVVLAQSCKLDDSGQLRLDGGLGDGGPADDGAADAGAGDAGRDTGGVGECTDETARPCGSDVGACALGVQACVGGTWAACEGGVGPSMEVCDGAIDEDCDGMVDEGCPCRTGAVRTCGSDVGECVVGTELCGAGDWGPCMGGIGPGTETCNGLDDDCDGETDESGCTCTHRVWGGSTYLVCPTATTYTLAMTGCHDLGYELVTVDTASENTWLQAQLPGGSRDTGAWIGLNDYATEGTFLWVATGLSPHFTNWRAGEPNGSGDCVNMAVSDGTWGDEQCTVTRLYVCEIP